MGSKLSTTRNCVAIWCDKPVYFSGDVIQGYVLLNVYDTFAAGSVDVEIKGQEKTSWIHHTTTHVTHHPHVHNHAAHHRHSHCTGAPGHVHTHVVHERHPHSAKRNFFRVTIPLATFDPGQPLPPGQHQFPFRVVLPVNLPGSFRYEDPRYHSYEHVVGKIAYKVSAEVVQGQRKGKHAHLHDCAEIVVRQRLARPPSEMVAETTTGVNFCCCFGRGTALLRLQADKDAYTAGETAYLILEVDNRTSLAFPHVVVKLQRVVSLRTTASSYCRTETVWKYQFDGLPKGSSYLGANAQRLAVPISSSLVPTTQGGGLVTCTYHAWVELSAGSLTNNPKLCVPITVYAAPPPHVAYAAPPEYWKPQMVYPAVNIDLPSAPPADPGLAPWGGGGGSGDGAPSPAYGLPVAAAPAAAAKEGYEPSAPPGVRY